jgi:integrase
LLANDAGYRLVAFVVRRDFLGAPCLCVEAHGAASAASVEGALFRPVKNNRTGHLDRHLDPASVYRNIVRKYGLETGISAEVNGLCVHSLRATAATNALSHDSDIAKVQEWLGACPDYPGW